MTILTIVLIAWIASAVIRTADSRHKAKQIQSIKTRQSKAEDEWKRVLAESKAETDRIVALEKARIEQEKWNWKQEELNRKQAEYNVKMSERMHKAEAKLELAISDITFLRDRLAQLDAQRDYIMLQQSGTVPGGKEHTKYQTKIISIDNQIHTTESRLAKAEFAKAEAERKLREVA